MKEKILLVLSGIQTIVLILILVILVPGKKKPEPKQMSAQVEARHRHTEPLIISETDPVWGSTDAPQTLVAYIDYECPYCRDLYKNLKEIENEYIKTGKVKVIFRDLPLKMHENAHKLAAITECARTQRKFWEMVELVMTSDEPYKEGHLTRWAEKLGLNPEKLERCTGDERILQAIEADVKDAKLRRLTGTPAVFINDVLYRGTLPAEDLRNIFEGKKVAKATNRGSCNPQ